MHCVQQVVLLSLFAVAICQSNLFLFVDPSAPQGGNGSKDSPFSNIQQALQSSSSANELNIMLSPGYYNGSSNIGLTYNQETKLIYGFDDVISFTCDTNNPVGFIANNNFELKNSPGLNIFEVSDCSVAIQANTTKTIQVTSVLFKNNEVALQLSANQIYVYHSKFTGGSMGIMGMVTYHSNSGFAAVGCNFDDGAAVYVQGFSNTVIEGGSMKNVHVTKYSPITFAQGGEMKLSLFLITNCSSTDSNYGGGLYTSQGEIEITGCRFTDCNGVNGGGVYVSLATFVLFDVRFENCTAQGYGGGMYVNSRGSEFSLFQVRFDRCSAAIGGGLDLEGNFFDTAMNDVVFTSNSATKGSCLACCSQSNECNFDVNVENFYQMDNSGECSLCSLNYY